MAVPNSEALDFSQAPFLVLWELTRACTLACAHCRAEAVRHRHPEELSTQEGERLLEEIAGFGTPLPLLVLTGGDPLLRPDVYDLVEAAARRGFRVALTPSGTAAVTREKLRRLKEAGLGRLAVSLDGSTPEVHDGFRRVRGAHGWTLKIIESAHAIGLPFQINSTVTRQNLTDLPAIASLLEPLGIVLWAVFFLVPTGRGRPEAQITAWEAERFLNDLYDLADRLPFGIKTTAAPHYRRVVLERQRGVRRDGRKSAEGSLGPQQAPAPDGIVRARDGVNDGKGVVFIDHLGEVCPSGFLPLSAGNVRQASLVELYRTHPLFRELRDPERLKNRCGICPYRELCGGSRARAYAQSGDYLADDPLCFYYPTP
jgi:radical SAM protein